MAQADGRYPLAQLDDIAPWFLDSIEVVRGQHRYSMARPHRVVSSHSPTSARSSSRKAKCVFSAGNHAQRSLRRDGPIGRTAASHLPNQGLSAAGPRGLTLPLRRPIALPRVAATRRSGAAIHRRHATKASSRPSCPLQFLLDPDNPSHKSPINGKLSSMQARAGNTQRAFILGAFGFTFRSYDFTASPNERTMVI